MKRGDSFLIPAPGTSLDTPHLWVVATEPDPLCIMVCLSSLRNAKDQTVVLHPGDHPFIVKPTTVMFGYAEIIDADHLAAQVLDGKAKPHSPCAEPVLELICSGILASPFTARRIQMFYKQWLSR